MSQPRPGGLGSVTDKLSPGRATLTEVQRVDRPAVTLRPIAQCCGGGGEVGAGVSGGWAAAGTGAGAVGAGLTGTLLFGGALTALVSLPVALRTAATKGSPPRG